MATLDDNRINTLQDVIQGNNAPAQVNAQLDVWNTSTAAPFVMTYQFETAQPGDLWMTFGGWTAMTGAEQAAIRTVLDEYEAVANVKFVLDTTSADPDINFGKVSLSGEGGMGGWNFAFGLDGNNNFTSRTMDHFAVFNNTLDLSAVANKNLMLHEIGHSMTLKHPGNYDAGGQLPTGPFLSAAEDNNKFSVMSYHENPDNGQFSDHLMVYDIAALQARWGANMSYHTGSDVYTGPNGNIQTIWDAGGSDTIDASGKIQAVSIDLHEGAFSSIGALNNLSIAYGAVIENATGGAGADTLIGNDGANVLQGNGGNDTVDGAGGIDTFVLSGARSQYQVTSVNGTSVTLIDLRSGSPDGTDIVSNVESFKFSDGTFSFADLTAPKPVPVSVAIGNATIVEGDSGSQMLRFTVTRSGGNSAFDVKFDTKAGTASAADGDYVGRSNTLHFNADDMTKTIDVAINGDTKFEATETFKLVLSNATNGVTITQDTGLGTIKNDDFAGSVSISDASITEGDSGTKTMLFTVTRTDGKVAFDVNFDTKAGSASSSDNDYVGRSNVLHFDEGETKKTIAVTINGDTKMEGTETFKMVLSNATEGAKIVHDTGIGTIADNDRAAHDFNGDGSSDILLQNNNGSIAMWQMNGLNATRLDVGTQPTSWHAVDSFDFSGDGKADILWQNNDGRVQVWQMNGATKSAVTDLGSMTSSWHIGAVDDFNGNGKGDVLWVNTSSGQMKLEMDGAQTSQSQTVDKSVPTGWTVKDAFDFTGDGKADILLQDGNQVEMWQMDGAHVVKTSVFAVDNTFHFAGAADFNGDGKGDIVWHNDASGKVMLWEMNGSNIISNTIAGTTPAGFEIKDIGDYNHDAKADIVLQNAAGTTLGWQMDGDHLVATQSLPAVSADWHLI